MTKCHRGSCHTGPGGWLPLSDGKEVHPHWWPHVETLLLLRGRGRLGFAVAPHTDALADAWTEVQRQEGSWEEPRRDPSSMGNRLSQEGAKLPYAEWAPRWPGSLGLAPTPRPPWDMWSC